MIESREKRWKLGKQRNQVAVDGGGRELQTAMAVRETKREREREREREERQMAERGSIDPNQKIQNLT